MKNPRWLGAKIEIVVKGLVSLVTSPKPHETPFFIHFYHTKTLEKFPILAQNYRLTYPFVKKSKMVAKQNGNIVNGSIVVSTFEHGLLNTTENTITYHNTIC